MKSDAMCTMSGSSPAAVAIASVNLVPRQHLVGRDVERLADCGRVAEDRDERPREVRVVRHRPE